MAHCAHIPAFVLHQVTCQFATGQTLFGPLSVSLEPSLCGLVGRNGVGKTRLLRLLAGLDSPAGGHIERAAAVAWVAQQPTLTPETRRENGGGKSWNRLMTQGLTAARVALRPPINQAFCRLSGRNIVRNPSSGRKAQIL